MSDILVKINRPDPLYNRTKDDFLKILKLTLEGKANKGYIFGSFNSDNFNSDSDIDIILIKETNLPFLKRYEDFTYILDLAPEIDLLVYTQEEFDRLIEDATGFWLSVKKSLLRFL